MADSKSKSSSSAPAPEPATVEATTSSDAQWSTYRRVEDQGARENIDPPYPGPQTQQVRGVPEEATD